MLTQHESHLRTYSARISQKLLCSKIVRTIGQNGSGLFISLQPEQISRHGIYEAFVPIARAMVDSVGPVAALRVLSAARIDINYDNDRLAGSWQGDQKIWHSADAKRQGTVGVNVEAEEETEAKLRRLAALRGLQRLLFLSSPDPFASSSSVHNDVSFSTQSSSSSSSCPELWSTREGCEGILRLHGNISALADELEGSGVNRILNGGKAETKDEKEGENEQLQANAERAHLKAVVKVLARGIGRNRNREKMSKSRRDGKGIRLLQCFRRFRDAGNIPDTELVNDILSAFVMAQDRRGLAVLLQVWRGGEGRL